MKKRLLLAVILAIVVVLCGELLRADLSPGPWHLNDYVTVTVDTHQFSTGNAYDATSILYSVYEHDTDNDVNEIITDTAMVKKDGKTGFYAATFQVLAATGFEENKNYSVFIAATVDSVAAVRSYGFRVTPNLALLLGIPVNGSLAQDIADVNAVIRQDIADVNSIVYNSYQYLTEVNETHITNVATKATLIENYITEVNETHIQNLVTEVSNTYSYLTDVNETYITQLITDITNTYNYLTDVNETYITNISQDVNVVADVTVVAAGTADVDEEHPATAQSFTLSTAFAAAANYYRPGTLILVKDADTDKYALGVVNGYTAARVVTLKDPLPFVPANGDVVKIPASAIAMPTLTRY